MIQRRDKAASGNTNMIYIILGIIVVLGGIGAVLFSKWKEPAIDPRLHGLSVDDYIVAQGDPNLDPTVSKELQSNDPDFNVYQTWQIAKRLARKDLETAIAQVEQTINVSPDLAGDAYFTMAQCVEFSMEIPLYENRTNPQMSRAELSARYDREFGYYQQAIQAYGQPGARTLLGVTRDPGEQRRKIENTIIPDKQKIKAWWMERTQ